MKRSIRLQRGAFTLIELLCVITILSLLIGLLIPVTGTVLVRAKNIQCLNNLRQIGMSANAAANDNSNQYPIIEIDPSTNGAVSGFDGNWKKLQDALAPYGCGPKIFQCPIDLAGPNNYAIYGSSYMWAPYSEGETDTTINRYTRRGQFNVPLSRVILASDWSACHAKGLGQSMDIYAVFADGHTSGSFNSNRKRSN